MSVIPTALTGIYAFANVTRMDLPQGVSNADQPWSDTWSQTQLAKEQKEHLRQPTLSQAIATGVCALSDEAHREGGKRSAGGSYARK